MRRICALAAVVIATSSLAACDDDVPRPRTTPSTQSSPAPDVPVGGNEGGDVPTDDLLELRHDGYRDLRLGMTTAQASSTGQLAVIGRARCREFVLANFGDGGGPHGYVDGRRGVAIVFGRYQMTTSEGVGVGTARSALRSAYPELRQSRGLLVARVSPSAEYFFRLGTDRTVNAFGVRLTDNRCMPPREVW